MAFVNGWLALAGVLCVGVPVLVHLLMRRRRRPVRWAAMRFLEEAVRRHRRALVVRRWLLLLTRCLVVLLVALALGRPVVSGVLGGAASGPRTVYLLIDDSIASGAVDGAGGAEALERLKAAARGVIRGLREGDRVGVVAMARPARALVLPAGLDRAAVSAVLEDVGVRSSGADVAGALRLVAEAIAQDGGAGAGGGAGAREGGVVVMLSEGRRGSYRVSDGLGGVLGGLAGGGGVRVVGLEPASSAVANVGVVGVEPLRSVTLVGGEEAGAAGVGGRARVSLERSGVLDGGVTGVRVSRGGDDGLGVGVAAGVVRWAAGQRLGSVSLEVPASDAGAEEGGGGGLGYAVAAVDRDGLAGDDVRWRGLVRRARLGVLVLGDGRSGGGGFGGTGELGAGEWMGLALEAAAGSPIEVRRGAPGAVDAASLSRAEAVLVPRPELVTGAGWSDLAGFARDGGLVMVTPPSGVSVHLWADGFVEAFGLGWRVAREAEVLGGGDGGGVGLDGASVVPGGGGLLGGLGGEFEELSRGVRVSRALLLDEGEGVRGDVLVRLGDGRAWMVAARPGGEGGASGGGGLVVYLGSAPEVGWTNLPLMPLMVALMQEVVRQGIGEARAGGSVVAGGGLPALEGEAVWRGPGGERLVSGAAMSAGVWRGVDPSGRAEREVVVHADVAGADVGVQSADAVRAWLGGAFGDTPVGGGDDAAGVVLVGGDGLSGAVGGGGAGGGGRGGSGEGVGEGWAVWLLGGGLLLAFCELVMARRFSYAVKGGV